MSIVKSLSVGRGDMFYITHNSDNFTIIDCCMPEDDRARIVKELKSQSKNKGVVRFISTHPDDDHIMGLAYLHEQMNILNFYCVKNEATKTDHSDDFDEYCELRDDTHKAFYLSKGCSRKWMNEPSEERGSAGINILWPVTSNEYHKEALRKAKEGKGPNNISPILTYNLEGGATILWMGDLEADFIDDISDQIEIGAADILIAPHHGRDSGKLPTGWLEEINPKLIIIGEAPSEHLNYYEGYNTITQNTAGDITLECTSGKTRIYVGNQDYSVDFLDYEEEMEGQTEYIGTLNM